MFSRRTESRSIASQLIVLFTLAAAVLLACGLGVFYWIVVRHAFAEDNAVLADKVSALSADFNEGGPKIFGKRMRSEEHTSELQSRPQIVCRVLLEEQNDTHTVLNMT